MDRTKDLDNASIVAIHTYCEQRAALTEQIKEMKMAVLDLKIQRIEKPSDAIEDKYKLELYKLRKLEAKKAALKPEINPNLFNFDDYFDCRFGRVMVAKYINNKYWKIVNEST